MDEELMKFTIEDEINTEDEAIIFGEINAEDLEQNIETEETVHVAEAEDAEEIVIEIEEAVGWVGGDSTRHYSLAGRDEFDQHPIKAISGLRDELDEIERLKTVYSDKVNIANYYKWHDASYDVYGYFVSLVPNTSTIKICDGSDILGVSINEAGFIGGQNVNVPRDNSYGLVATSGLVDVRCELDVAVGDYVTSNAYGYATKTDLGYGYKVLAKETKNGIEYAVIMLGVQADTIHALGAEFDAIDKRVRANETNIISAINTAHQAYNKANEIGVSNGVMSDKVDNALGVVGGLTSEVEDLRNQVASSTLTSIQAQAIANLAATSAESMKEEAIEKADEALKDTSELRRELEATAAEINTDLENAALELGATKESIVNTKDELQKNINNVSKDLEDTKLEFQQANGSLTKDLENAQKDIEAGVKNLEDTKKALEGSIKKTVDGIEALEKDLTPLSTWPESATGDDTKGIAGFVAKANEDSTTLGNLVTWKNGTGDESLAGFVSKATSENAEIQALAQYGYIDENSVKHYGAAAIMAEVDKNKSSIEAIAGMDGSLAGLQAQVDKNAASVSTLASYVVGEYTAVETWSTENKDINKIYYAENTKYYWYYDDGWKSTDKPYKARLAGALAGVQQTADSNRAELDAVASYEKDGKKGLAGLTAQVDENKTELATVATYEAGNKKGLAGLIAQVDADKASVATLTSWSSNLHIGGRNLLADSDKEVTKPSGSYNPEFIQFADIAPIFDAYGLIEYTISFDIKSADISKCSEIQLYCQNGSGTKHSIGSKKIPVTTEYVRHHHTFTPTIQSETETKSMLAFYGEYGTGNIPFVKNVKIEKGNKATNWTPAPEDAVESIAGLQVQVNENAASVATVASHIIGEYTTVKTWDITNKNIGKIYYSEDTKKYWYYDVGWKSTDKPYQTKPPLSGALTGIQQTADTNKANIEMITGLTGEFGESLSGFVSNTTEQNAEIKALAQYGYMDDNGDKHYGAAGIMAEVDKNKSAISALAGIDGSLAGLQAQVNENTASVATLASWSMDGRNLLPDTDFGGEAKRYEILPGKPSEGGFRFTPTVQIESGIDYTLSTKIRGKSDVVFYEMNDGKNVSHLWIEKKDLSEDEYKSFSITFRVGPSNKFKQVYICTRYNVSTEGDWFEIAPNSLQLEKGNQATDWCASPVDTATSIAGVKSMAAANKAQFDAMAAYDTNDGDKSALVGITAYVNANSANFKTLAKYSNKDSNRSGIAGLVADVDANTSALSLVAEHSFTDNSGEIHTGLAGLKAQVNDNTSEVALVANRVSGKYVVVAEYPIGNENAIAKLDTTKFYHSDQVTYWYYNGSKWQSVNTFTEFVKVYNVDEDVVYYVGGNYKKYLYYNNSWISTESAYEAGLTEAITGIQVEVDENSSSINNLTSWQSDTNIAMARVEQKADANGAYIQSTVSNMDKYSVGPHSQAYGFTLEQAASVLEEGMIYVPTKSVTEEYEYTDVDGKPQTYERTFTPQYLYKWGKVNGQYRWITVDKNYTETNETNTSSKAVYFTTTEPAVSGNFGYWYTNGNTITGTTGIYEPYTLYKWDSYVDENNVTQYHWVAVATLAGNSNSRAVSQIRQDANSIETSVINMKGDVTSSKQWIDDNSTNIQDVVTWKSQNAESIATTIQNASDSSAYIAQIASVTNKDGTVNAAASIVTAVNNDTSGVTINADHLSFNGKSFDLTISEAIDGVEIGGRNLLLQSGHWDTLPTLWELNNGVIELDESNKYLSHNTLKININSQMYLRGSSFFELDTNKTYTYSAIIKSNADYVGASNIPLHFHCANNASDSSNTAGVSVIKYQQALTAGEWTLVYMTFKPNGPYFRPFVYMSGSDVRVFNIAYLKLEEGNKATDWTPAPEDTVDKKSIIASINASTEGITISANKIDIKGSVTFEALDTDVQTSIKNSIASTTIEYALSGSSTTAPTSGWSTTAPQWQKGSYMWQRTTIEYTDANKQKTITTTCIQGAKGEQGIQGNDGKTPVKGVDYFDGKDGKDGYTPVKGVDYFDGTNGQNGKDGTSIVWKGTYASAPSGAQNGWAYYNSTAKASYTYQNGSWYQMSIDGVDGQDGSDGSSIVWKGESSSAPASPQENWVYKDTDDGKVYIYNGSGWELMVLDGSDGQDGTDGSDGLSVFITYNDSSTTPSTPTGNGTTNGWHTAATSTSVWMSQKVASAANEGTWGAPIKIKGEDGAANYLQVKYINSDKIPTITNNNVSGWSDIVPSVESGKHTYMIQKLSNETNWSYPIQISATDGTTPTISINDDGCWVINGENTTIKAEGKDGNTPTITVGANGNWYVDGKDSGQKAQGNAGADGSCIEYVYYRSESAQSNLTTPSYSGTTLTSGWTPSPQGITDKYKYEYMSMRTKPSGINTSWSSFSTPVIWSKWGEKGQDGDGVEYKYCLINSATKPTYPTPQGQTYTWTDDPRGVSLSNQYEYVVQIKHITENGVSTQVESNVALWSKYGASGVSVTGVVTRYYITTGNSSSDKPDNDVSDDKGWFDDFDTTINRYWQLKEESQDETATYYIWSQEKVTYSDGGVSYTDATVNSANSAIASWCVNNDVTKIHGGHIATGSITADQIAANTITADKIATNALKSTNYKSGNDDSDIPTNPGSVTAGTFFDLSTGAIYSKNFCITGDYASFEGDISGASGTFTGDLSGSDIIGGTININNNFIVDGDGNVTLAGAITWGEGKGISEVNGQIYIDAGMISGKGITIDLNSGTINCENNGNKFELDDYALTFDGRIFINGAAFYMDTAQKYHADFSCLTKFSYGAEFTSGVTITGGLTVDTFSIASLNLTDELSVSSLTVRGIATINDALTVAGDLGTTGNLSVNGMATVGQLYLDGYGKVSIDNGFLRVGQ